MELTKCQFLEIAFLGVGGVRKEGDMPGGAKKELIFENKFCGMRIFTYFCSSIMIPALNRCEVVCGCIVVLCAARDLYLCLK